MSLVLLLLACGAIGPAAPAPLDLPSYDEVTVVPTGRSTGELAPDGDLPRVDGEGMLHLTDVLGPGGSRAAVLAFMASWCGPCESSLPTLAALEAAHPAEELTVLVLSTDVNPVGRGKLAAKVRAAGLRGPVVWAPPPTQGVWMGEHAVPRYFYLDATGRIVEQDKGFDADIGRRMPARVAMALGELPAPD